MLERRRKKSQSETYRRSVMNTAQPLKNIYRDGSNVITKGYMSTIKEVARAIKATNQKTS
jgi:hypothetical protein